MKLTRFFGGVHWNEGEAFLFTRAGVTKMAVQQAPKVPMVSGQPEADVTTQVFHYSPLRYLQTMVAIAWSAFAHPFSSTVIDLSTGQIRQAETET